MALVDYYLLLGVPRSASTPAILEAFRRAAKTAHPDAGGSHEQFLVLDFARRLLTDRSHRDRYDLVLEVQDVMASPTLETVKSVLARTEPRIQDWRCPLEIAGDVLTVLAQATEWVDSKARDQQRSPRAARGPASTSRTQHQARPASAEDIRQREYRHLDSLRGTVDWMMKQWPTLVDGLDEPQPVSTIRHRLHLGYQIYSILRLAQDAFARIDTASRPEDIRYYFHLSRALVDIAFELTRLSKVWGLGYQFKSQTWLQAQLRRSESELKRRNLEKGAAPWPMTRPDRGSTSPPRHDEPESAAHSDKTRQQANPPTSGGTSSGPTPGQGRGAPRHGPPTEAPHTRKDRQPKAQAAVKHTYADSESHGFGIGWLVVALLVGVPLVWLALSILRTNESEPSGLYFDGAVKDSRVTCFSSTPIDERQRGTGVVLECDLGDYSTGNGDQPYLEAWSEGCARVRVDGDDSEVLVHRTLRVTPCGAPIEVVKWRICQTRGGPLPDDCKAGSEEIP